jgi:hypothetical protein
MRWRFNELYWQLQVLCVVAPPFLAFLAVRALADGDYRRASILSGLLCAVPIYFLIPYIAIKACRTTRWHERQQHRHPGDHRGEAPEPWNRPSSHTERGRSGG